MSATQLSLFSVRPHVARVTAFNRARYDQEAARQLARCEGILAQQHAAETPPFRRCLVCSGREDVTQPHAHPEAA